MDRLKAMATFVRIVDTGSLSAAAEASGQSAASVVRSLAALEKHLGVRLLNRNTRRLALTDEGLEFLAWSRRMLSEFDEIEHSFDARRHSPGGLLRLTAPVEFGRRYVAPLVNAFLAQHPAMRIELILLDRMADLLEEGLDLAIRIGQLPDSSMVATPLGRTRYVVCASPDYLRHQEVLQSPSALHRHACIVLVPHCREWHFLDRGRAISEAVPVRLATNQVHVARLACLQGVGIARLLHYQIAGELADGRLVRLLQAFEPADVPVQMVYPHSRLLSPRVRLFIDWMAERLGPQIPDPGA
ncbi:LysR family transcriptional regulator [Thauera linaloolentis]|uniref:LysR family transcriptional regulator n=1 Tax=Thauera linaloolentis (strain DSM 12138 / JCM 21573 / CCUG 41526 / CIP 105981 / IAM 15112 / NBRC 102519 / 47Lol) TaxID=1123367 RepID=N6Z581_THAL4|nr:LysR family transcriptional regulator [Thauera linaloolentis]ENO89727.1 LysR family transcriptional regulator [Thauera linaloolentis 47Lol = DSM 12138]MCM8566025.1 LysR family transcriptional regulator [Thauera linaloolentis]